MRKVKTKPQHFYDADGRYLKSLKCFYTGECPGCGKKVLLVRRYGKRYVLDAEQLYLLKPNWLGADEIYTKDGVWHRGTLVRNPDLSETYIAGYLLHKCK